METPTAAQIIEALRDSPRAPEWAVAGATRVRIETLEPAAPASSREARLVRVTVARPETAGALEGARSKNGTLLVQALAEITPSGKLLSGDELEANLYGLTPLGDDAHQIVAPGFAAVSAALVEGVPYQDAPGGSLHGAEPALRPTLPQSDLAGPPHAGDSDSLIHR